MATENSASSGASHLPPSWPEARDDVPSSWPSGGQEPSGVPMSWPEAAPAQPSWPEAPQAPAWPDPPRGDAAWPEAPRNDVHRNDGSRSPRQGGDASWPEQPRQSWPEAPRQEPGWPETPRQQDVPVSWPEQPQPIQPQDPVPAWSQPPTPSANAWSNLSTPAPWPNSPSNVPPGGPSASLGDPLDHTVTLGRAPGPLDAPIQPGRPVQPGQPGLSPLDGPGGPSAVPADERTMMYGGRPGDGILGDQAVPSNQLGAAHVGAPPPGGQGMPGGPGMHGDGHPDQARPGSNLNRDPSDPDRRFVTAGQISGSRTPPPDRQQELWNNVFGDEFEGMSEHDSLDDESGKPIWIYALGGSVAIALVAALLWAFLAGPLAGEDTPESKTAASPAASGGPTKGGTGKTSTTIPALPKYPGKASPVTGRVEDAAAGVSLPRLGGTWQLDQRATVKSTFGYDTRQYVQVAPEKYAQIMSGPLPSQLSSLYEEDNLEPVIKRMVLQARKNLYPAGNKVRKIAQQSIKVGASTGRLIAYTMTAGTDKATIVTMAINAGGDVPAIVFVSIPEEGKQLLPDIRTVMNQLKVSAQ
ncbi:hypothetical protein ACIBIZ_40800 [Nonomuraea spiralis]|uniref:hypothetical protein n=1 Tax=Nonomuraea spiralis TaxID=46182 RepID=UPI0037B66998